MRQWRGGEIEQGVSRDINKYIHQLREDTQAKWKTEIYLSQPFYLHFDCWTWLRIRHKVCKSHKGFTKPHMSWVINMPTVLTCMCVCVCVYGKISSPSIYINTSLNSCQTTPDQKSFHVILAFNYQQYSNYTSLLIKIKVYI